ncbi:TetR/AcrR family transcriptional regulator [Novosphingobium sp. PS1R-30]|uniref:TetR/AcrR family transcriptional regulator n=1 Tax=Novosphingobium anseongense TaxID=3133436 RepID=A0ABU8RWL2_9SPHN
MAVGIRGKGRPKLTETAEIDLAIREATLQAMLEHGEAATMHAIAQAAGLSRKSLYARYPNKQALFVGIIRDALTNAEALQYEGGGSAEERLLHYIEAALAAITRPESQALQHLLRRDHGYISALKTEMLDATRKIFFAPLAALLGEAKAAGELAIDDVEATARATIQLIFAEGLRPDDDRPRGLTHGLRGDYAAFLTRLLTRGLTPRRP